MKKKTIYRNRRRHNILYERRDLRFGPVLLCKSSYKMFGVVDKHVFYIFLAFFLLLFFAAFVFICVLDILRI